MIQNILDLLVHTRKHAEASPLISEDILIAEPGISGREYERLIKTFPTLPDSYIKFIRMYDVKKVSICNYRISMCNTKEEDTTEKLLYWNNREEEIQVIQKLHDLTLIASSDIYDIYVAGTQSDYNEGEILSIDHELYLEDEVPIIKVAPDYETFLIICANKYELEMTEDIDDNDILNELRRRLDALNLSKEYYEYWVK
jgi:hypothetical protein